MSLEPNLQVSGALLPLSAPQVSSVGQPVCESSLLFSLEEGHQHVKTSSPPPISPERTRLPGPLEASPLQLFPLQRTSLSVPSEQPTIDFPQCPESLAHASGLQADSSQQQHLLRRCTAQPASPVLPEIVATHSCQPQPSDKPALLTVSGGEGVFSKQEQQHWSGQLRQASPLTCRQVYPAALATHDAVFANQSLFLETLYSLHAALGSRMIVAKVGGKDLDVHKLYQEVSSRGGLEVVIKGKKWKDVTHAFDFPPSATNASYVLQENYITLLHHYEQVYFFRVLGEVISPPAPCAIQSPGVSQPADTDMNADGLGEVESGLKKTQGILDSAQALGVDPASSIGTVVTGAIDGKFDHGYFVTVMVGARKMRGVLYHVPSTNAIPQNACVPALLKNVGSDLKPSDLVQKVSQKRRKKDISRKDPNAPRQNRTGYNYFFAEQRAKLKTMQPDKDRAISKTIGDLWSKLSEDEKSPYQEQGLKDKERYRREMREYREKIKLPMTCEEHASDSMGTKQVLGGRDSGNGDVDCFKVAKSIATMGENYCRNIQSDASTSIGSRIPVNHNEQTGLMSPVEQ